MWKNHSPIKFIHPLVLIYELLVESISHGTCHLFRTRFKMIYINEFPRYLADKTLRNFSGCPRWILCSAPGTLAVGSLPAAGGLKTNAFAVRRFSPYITPCCWIDVLMSICVGVASNPVNISLFLFSYKFSPYNLTVFTAYRIHLLKL